MSAQTIQAESAKLQTQASISHAAFMSELDDLIERTNSLATYAGIGYCNAWLEETDCNIVEFNLQRQSVYLYQMMEAIESRAIDGEPS